MDYGYTGSQMESEIFGEAREDQGEGKPEYLSYRQAMETVKRLQPDSDPTEPNPRFARDVHATIFAELGITPDQLRFYTAVHSMLDRKHGVDAFFEVGDIQGYTVVTLDVTTNPAKSELGKADVIFHMPKEGLDPKVDRKEYSEKVQEVASRVIQSLEYKKVREAS